MATITLFSVPGVSASHLGEDLTSNSGFEEWDAGKPVNWTTPHSDWEIVQISGTSGNFSLMLETNRYTSPSSANMVSESIDVNEDDLFFVTTKVRSNNAINTKVRLKGYDDDRKKWITLKTFNPSSDIQHVFYTVPEDITQLRMRLEAGYVDDKDCGPASSYFDDINIIDPSVENAEFYLEEGVISNNESLKIGSYELDLVEAKDNKALVSVMASGKAIGSEVLIPGETVDFKIDSDKYLVFLVNDVFVNEEYSEVRISHLMAGRIVAEAPTIQPIEEDGLILYLPLDENEGSEIYDYSGRSYYGSTYGADWTEGMDNSCLEFDGLTDYVKIPDTSSTFEEGDHTFTLWVKSTGVRDSKKYILCHYNWRLGWRSDSTLRFTVGRMNDKDGPSYSIDAEVPELKNDWIHLAGVYKPSENKIMFYVNGEYAGEKDIGEDRIWADYGNRDLLVGTSKHGAATFFEGQVDEVRIYDRALSQQEIGEIMSRSLGLSGISSYHNSISIEKDEAVSVGNGFCLQYSNAPYSNLVLIEGITQTNVYSLANDSAGQSLLLKNAQGTPVIRLNIESITSEKLILSDIWVADEKADAPILEIRSINFSEIRTYEPATIDVTIVNSGSRTYRPGGEDSIELYLEDDKVDSYKISNDLAPGDTLEYSFEVCSQEAGKSQIMAIISTDSATNTLSTTAKIEPPINPPVTRMPLYIEETESGITLHLTLHGSGIKGESWNDNALITIGINNPLGSRTFYENSHKVSGTGVRIKIPYEEFYEGDEQYIVTVKFRDAENSVMTKIAGEEGTYKPPNNSLLLVALFVPLLGYVIRKKIY
ncbi:LamG domain-containing protein [Methanococcoides seepicolus]|uniref:LamG domain-containing protein n=1 Tax=Methanococcoides seepicolus TaxID=2828780 RepID=A0A9E4ZHC3_9EURY|nr:LamG domain-containing protein [Methanococcoides seepicolus]MCM1987224.1 LamG domain-containing protein [Methanococcoides seepicolus]MCM1987503.1 LamG domain-containing protein [Methanococcoides seepicolus]